MITSNLVLSPLEQLPDYDQKIAKWLASNSGKKKKQRQSKSKDMLFGIETPSGNIYRTIATTNEDEYIAVCDFLFLMGFSADDIHKEGERGVTDIFRP